MIAKSIISIITLFISIVSLGQIVQGRYISDYSLIAKKYNVRPPNLPNGYPIWYDHDSIPMGTVVLLRNDLPEPYIKLNDTAYVTEPTVENARIVKNFAGEIKEYHQFVIIPDYQVSYKDMRQFCDSLASDLSNATFLFVSENLTYCPEYFTNYKKLYDGIIVCWRVENFLDIRMNQYWKFLVENQLTELSVISEITFKKFTSYFESGYYSEDFDYRRYDEASIQKEIDNYEEAVKNEGDSDLFRNELGKRNRLKLWVKRYKPHEMHILDVGSYTRIELRGNELTIKEFYMLMDEYTTGLLRARNHISELFFSQPYQFQFANFQFDKTRFIEYQVRDNMIKWVEPVYPLPKIDDIVIVEN